MPYGPLGPGSLFDRIAQGLGRGISGPLPPGLDPEQQRMIHRGALGRSGLATVQAAQTQGGPAAIASGIQAGRDYAGAQSNQLIRQALGSGELDDPELLRQMFIQAFSEGDTAAMQAIGARLNAMEQNDLGAGVFPGADERGYPYDRVTGEATGAPPLGPAASATQNEWSFPILNDTLVATRTGDDGQPEVRPVLQIREPLDTGERDDDLEATARGFIDDIQQLRLPTVAVATQQIMDLVDTFIDDPNPMSDIALTIAYARASDPGNTVREGERDFILTGASFFEKMQRFFTRTAEGIVLNPNLREGMRTATLTLAKSHVDLYESLRNATTGRLANRGYSSEEIERSLWNPFPERVSEAAKDTVDPGRVLERRLQGQLNDLSPLGNMMQMPNGIQIIHDPIRGTTRIRFPDAQSADNFERQFDVALPQFERSFSTASAPPGGLQ